MRARQRDRAVFVGVFESDVDEERTVAFGPVEPLLEFVPGNARHGHAVLSLPAAESVNPQRRSLRAGPGGRGVIVVTMDDPALRAASADQAAQEHGASIAADGVVVAGDVAGNPVPHGANPCIVNWSDDPRRGNDRATCTRRRTHRQCARFHETTCIGARVKSAKRAHFRPEDHNSDDNSP